MSQNMQRVGRYPMNNPTGLFLTDQINKANKAALFKDSFGIRLYDTLRFKAGAAIPTSEFTLFGIASGQQAFIANAPNEQYQKTLIDTNLNVAQLLTAGQKIIARSLQVRILPTGSTDTAYGSTGPGIELPTDPSANTAVCSTNLAAAILNAASITFTVSSKDYEKGKLIHFPSPYGISGFAGGGAADNFESVSNNGFGRPYFFPIEREIPALTNFSCGVQFGYPLTPTRNFTLEVCIEGIFYRPVQ